MKLTREETLALYEQIAPHLEAIERLFKSPVLTLVVRAPQLPDGDLVMTQDEPAKIIASVQKLMARTPALAPPQLVAIDGRFVI